MSTLILRDATLAICGAPELRGDPGEHITARIAEVQAMAPEALAECLGVLLDANALGEDAELELLTALVIAGLANPELCEGRGLNGLASARRLASRLEQDGKPDAALSIIEQLRVLYPSHQALERDYDAVLGRLGMVLNLADRYYDRAQQLLQAGEIEEAMGWLREVLLLDSTRRDVARQIRDLRLSVSRPKIKFKVHWRLLAIGISVPMALVGVVLREKNLHEAYGVLPSAQANDLDSGRERLQALNVFAEQNPIWHGSILVQRERTQLRLSVDQLLEVEAARRKSEAEQLEERMQRANSTRLHARRQVALGNFSEALSSFEEARSTAPTGWEFIEEVDRNIQDLRTYLADQQQQQSR